MTSRLRLSTAESMHADLQAMIGGDDIVVAVLPSPQGTSHPAHQRLTDIPDDFVGAIVQTSGTTGDPKHVLLDREALVTAATLAAERLGNTGAWSNPLPPFYVAGLMTAVRAIVAGEEYIPISPDLSDLGQTHRASYISIVPTHLHIALSDPKICHRLSHFNAVLVGGAPLDPLARKRAGSAGIPIIQTYGMSETCGGVVYDSVPLTGVTPRIADDGRIALRTPTAFTGYLGLPDETAAVLTDATVLTNDRGTWDGRELTVTGRMDDVIQSGGANVDLAALQRILDEKFFGLTACFAVPSPTWGSTVIVASVGPSLEEVVDSLGQRIESAAKPRGVIRLDYLPRTHSGKIDRSELTRLWEEEHGVAA